MGKLAIGVGGSRIGLGIGRHGTRQRADARRFERAEREGTKRNDHPQDGLRAAFGRWCPPGMRRVCGPARCWCAPC